MKNKFLNIMVFVMAVFLIYPVTVVNAASLGISASSTSVTTGSTVRITVKASGLAGRFSITSSNSSVLSGGTSSEWLENESKTYTFTAKSIGSATITVKAINAADSSSSAAFTGSKSITINVVKPREKSTNNNLKSLSVEGYTLTPEFNADTLEYTVEIGDNAEKITINAEKEDSYASLEGAGEVEVVEGNNKLEVKVTSETGVEKIYTINANVKDDNPIEETIDGKTYTVVKRIKSLILPDALNIELFTETTVMLDETEIPAYTSEELNLTLIGLKDESGNIYLYRYEDSKIGEMYEIITSNTLSVLFKEPAEELEGYTKTTITINNKEYTAYQNEYKDYVLIYGTNIDTNEDNWYLYNIKEGTLQTYMKDMIDDLNNKYAKEIEQYKMAILGLSGLSLLLLLTVIIVIIKKGKKKKVHTTKKEENKTKLKSLENLENTKEIDKAQIIINKVEHPVKEEKKVEEKKPKKKDKKKKKEEKKQDEFLNDDDLKEILSTKEIKKTSKLDELEDMDTEFLDDYKRIKKKKK